MVCTIYFSLRGLNRRYVGFFMSCLFLPHTCAAQPLIETDFLHNRRSKRTPPFFAKRGSVSLRATPNCEMNYNRRSPSVLTSTVDQNAPYRFSQSKIAASSSLVWDAKSFSAIDIIGFQSQPLDASIL